MYMICAFLCEVVACLCGFEKSHQCEIVCLSVHLLRKGFCILFFTHCGIMKQYCKQIDLEFNNFYFTINFAFSFHQSIHK